MIFISLESGRIGIPQKMKRIRKLSLKNIKNCLTTYKHIFLFSSFGYILWNIYIDIPHRNFDILDRKYLDFQDIHYDQHTHFALKVVDSLSHIYTDSCRMCPRTECTSGFYCSNICKASFYIHLYLKRAFKDINGVRYHKNLLKSAVKLTLIVRKLLRAE